MDLKDLSNIGQKEGKISITETTKVKTLWIFKNDSNNPNHEKDYMRAILLANPDKDKLLKEYPIEKFMRIETETWLEAKKEFYRISGIEEKKEEFAGNPNIDSKIKPSPVSNNPKNYDGFDEAPKHSEIAKTNDESLDKKEIAESIQEHFDKKFDTPNLDKLASEQPIEEQKEFQELKEEIKEATNKDYHSDKSEMSFSLAIEKYPLIYQLIDVLEGIVVGPRLFTFDSDRIVIASMEESAALFLFLQIPNLAFTNYKVESTNRLGLSLTDLKKIIHPDKIKAKNTDQIYFKYNEEIGYNHFCIEYWMKRTHITRKINVHVPDVDNQDTIDKVKAIPLDALITLRDKEDIEEFFEYSKQVDMIKDLKHIEIGLVKGKLYLEEKGDATNNQNRMVTEFKAVTDNENFGTLYDWDNIFKVFKLMNSKIGKFINKITIEFSFENPLRIVITYQDEIEFVFLVAPLDTAEEEEF